jgi:ADP-ribose pyrophosphatase YjhB (NUDIX family)
VGYIESLRRMIGTERLLTPSTACLIVDADGRVLLQRRVDSGSWSCPGGMLELGETVIQCVRREVAEETGLTTRDESLFGIYSGPEYFGTYPNGDRIASLLLVFSTREFAGALRADRESSELRFFPSGELPAPLAGHHRAYLHDFARWGRGEIRVPIVR